MDCMLVRLRDRYSDESIAMLPEDVRALVLMAEAEMYFGDPEEISQDVARVDCRVRPNAAWRELERLYGVH